jgi:hypothetical protein
MRGVTFEGMGVGAVGSRAFFLEAAGLVFVEAGVAVAAVGKEGALNDIK